MVVLKLDNCFQVVSALNEYETKNEKLVSDIEKASECLRTTRKKYSKLKDKYLALSKRFAKLNGERLNKSLGTEDSSMDISKIMTELQESKDETEKANAKLRAEIENLREEMGRDRYQMKAVRKANVVLMKQSRCLYLESEEAKRRGEESSITMSRNQEIIESLRQERDSLEREQAKLQDRVSHLEQETRKANEKCESYFTIKNKRELDYETKARECRMHSQQLEKLKRENDILHMQRKELRTTELSGYPRLHNVSGKTRELSLQRTTNEQASETVESRGPSRIADYSSFSPRPTAESSTCMSESMMSQSLEDANGIPVVFNNVKNEDKMVRYRYVLLHPSDPCPRFEIILQLLCNAFIAFSYLTRF